MTVALDEDVTGYRRLSPRKHATTLNENRFTRTLPPLLSSSPPSPLPIPPPPSTTLNLETESKPRFDEPHPPPDIKSSSTHTRRRPSRLNRFVSSSPSSSSFSEAASHLPAWLQRWISHVLSTLLLIVLQLCVVYSKFTKPRTTSRSSARENEKKAYRTIDELDDDDELDEESDEIEGLSVKGDPKQSWGETKMVDEGRRRRGFTGPDLRPATAEEEEELVSDDTMYYAERWGFEFEEHRVKTGDGFVLDVFRINEKGADKRECKGPMLLVHGLFQSSGVFVTNEEHSMAFYFARLGYDVWLGNNRGVTSRRESTTTTAASEIELEERWDWSLDDLSRYDFPAMIDHVLATTGREKLVYVGHSQGNAQAFMGIRTDPSVADKISCFVALAPAVYLGPLLKSRFPLKYLVDMSDSTFTMMFGTTAFLPILKLARRYLSPELFAAVGYETFAYLFDWSDENWVPTRKVKYFRYMPQPTSTRAIQQWMKAGRRSMLVSRDDEEDDAIDRYDFEAITCPMMIFYGGKDHLVSGSRLQQELAENHPNAKVLYTSEIPHYEHLDPVKAIDAEKWVWEKMVDVLRDNKIR